MSDVVEPKTTHKKKLGTRLAQFFHHGPQLGPFHSAFRHLDVENLPRFQIMNSRPEDWAMPVTICSSEPKVGSSAIDSTLVTAHVATKTAFDDFLNCACQTCPSTPRCRHRWASSDQPARCSCRRRAAKTAAGQALFWPHHLQSFETIFKYRWLQEVNNAVKNYIELPTQSCHLLCNSLASQTHIGKRSRFRLWFALGFCLTWQMNGVHEEEKLGCSTLKE